MLLKPFFHDLTELVDPGIDLFYFINFQFIKYFPSLLLLFQQVAFRQYAQVLGYGLAGDVEVRCNVVGGHRLYGDQYEDRPPGWVCYGLKNVASHVR